MDYRNPPNAAQGYAVLGGQAIGLNSNEALSSQKAYAAACDAQAVQPARESDAALQRIAHQIDIINNHSQRVSMVADRIVGSRPRDVACAGTATPGMPNFTAKLHMIADALSRLNADMADNADRLESFI